MANLSNINNKFLVTTTGEVLIGQTANNGNRLQITGADGASYIYLKTDVATTGGRIGFNSDDLRVFNQQAGGDLSFGTVGTERMKIDQFGQIFSFGQIRLELAATETNPIVGTNCSFLFQNTSNTDGNLAVVDFRNSTGFVTGRIGAQFQDAGDRNTDLFFMTRANGGNLTERMRITSNGNTTFVKGTDSDRAANSIKHAANSFLYIKGGAAGVSLNDDGEDTRIILFNNSNIRFDAGTKDNAMIIEGNTGNVQVNETVGQRRFNVYDATDAWIRLYCGSSADWIFGSNGSDHAFKWYNQSSNGVAGYKMNLASNGTLTVKGDVIAYGNPSDKRLKENIKPIDSALDKVSKLQGVTFDWKKSDSILDIKEDIGFIAQDVQKVLPELVRENEDGMLSMRHQGIAPILLEAIKELKAEIEELKNKPCNCNCK